MMACKNATLYYTSLPFRGLRLDEIHKKVHGKSNVSKGGQMVFIYDAVSFIRENMYTDKLAAQDMTGQHNEDHTRFIPFYSS